MSASGSLTPVDATLSVWLKGADLVATTAELALRHKMGFSRELAGLKRQDFYRFSIYTPGDPRRMVAALRGVLDAQSTFYNRNKHQFDLVCAWSGTGGEEKIEEGIACKTLQERFVSALADKLHESGVEESSGKRPFEKVTLDATFSYLAEVMVEDDDASARTAVAVRLRAGLSAIEGLDDIRVECRHRATRWWLALRAAGEDAARDLARRITVTTRRDAGLLMNPSYQRAEFISVLPL